MDSWVDEWMGVWINRGMSTCMDRQIDGWVVRWERGGGWM